VHTPTFPPRRDDQEIRTAVAALGARLLSVDAIAPDASTRRFYRLALAGRPGVVACVYPSGEEARLHHDWAVQQWAWARRLPVPEPLACTPRVIVSADLGDRGLDGVLRGEGTSALPAVLQCLKAFQDCPREDVPNPPFDAALFRRELEGFTTFLDPRAAADAAVNAFLDHLSQRLVQHPYRITHRDFHANNLLLHQGRVHAVDFQDLRNGPDTYDLVSLLRERAGGEAVEDEARWCREAAQLLRWESGWWDRHLECACQRGLKVLGTFLRLGRGGQPCYLRYVPSAAHKTRQALAEVGAPRVLVDGVASFADARAYNGSGEEPRNHVRQPWTS